MCGGRRRRDDLREGSTELASPGAMPVALAAAVLVFVAFETTWYSTGRMYLGGFAVVNLAAAVVIAHVFANQSSLLSRSLSQRTLVWLGKRSYGLYLFLRPPSFSCCLPQDWVSAASAAMQRSSSISQ